MDVPMLNKEEFVVAYELYGKGFKNLKKDRQERFKRIIRLL